MGHLEQGTYPYIPNQRGIMFQNVEGKGAKSIPLVGGSGRKLDCVVQVGNGWGEINVEDRKLHQNYFMAADVINGRLSLNLSTRNANLVHHPDFYAACFVDLAMNNLQPIESVLAKWDNDSLNHKIFTAICQRIADAELAARSTWTGKLTGKYGFTHIERVHTQKAAVAVLFTKQPNPQ